MSQNPQVAAAYPPPGTAFPYSQPPQPHGGFSAPPPPPGYPVRDEQGRSEASAPAQTQSRGDGFWKGCCAGLCCCCALETCF